MSLVSNVIRQSDLEMYVVWAVTGVHGFFIWFQFSPKHKRSIEIFKMQLVAIRHILPIVLKTHAEKSQMTSFDRQMYLAYYLSQYVLYVCMNAFLLLPAWIRVPNFAIYGPLYLLAISFWDLEGSQISDTFLKLISSP